MLLSPVGRAGKRIEEQTMTTETKGKSFQELAQDPISTVYHDEFCAGVRFIVARGPASLCAYVGVPKDHPLAGHSYHDLPSIDCHGGLTFSKEGKESSPWPVGFWWYGWDYAHAGDFAFYDLDPQFPRFKDSKKDKRWTVEMVTQDSQSAIYDFVTLAKFCEEVAGG